jgi:branched-chain amino acid transport system permease protein
VDWDFLVQQLVNGLTLGSMYALIALGYTMVYGILKLLNFAHGEVYMIGAFAGFGVMTALGGPDAPIVPVALMVLVMFLAGMSASGVRRRSFSSAPASEATTLRATSTSGPASTGGRSTSRRCACSRS